MFVAAGTVRAASVVEASISSRFLISGEQATLDIVVPSDEMDPPEIPEVKNLTIRPIGMGPGRRLTQGRRIEFYFSYMVASYEVGDYVIPPVEIVVDGETRRTAPIELRVIDDSTLKWSKVTLDNREVRYSAAFHAVKGKPYVGEKQPVEIKIYFPAEQPVADWGIPDFERDGVSAWRFQPQQPQQGMASRNSRRASLLGRTYHAVSYPSTMSANRTGETTLGPASVRIQAVSPSVSQFSESYTEALNLTIPAITIDSRPLPPNAPEGFDNAIGQFDISVSSRETEVRESDPVTVNITVTGSGNLDAMQPPKPLDAEGWKLYDASSTERGEERREMWGQVDYRQFMRPLRLQSSIPPFRLIYFDPAKDSYETILSDAIPLNVLPSTAAAVAGAAVPQALPMPLEEMTDILGIMKEPAALISRRTPIPGWAWQVIPALIVLGLLVSIAKRKLGPRLRKDPDAIEREREWRQVERAPDQTGAFYRSVGHFIERWLGDRTDPQIAEVLAKRDEVAFRQEIAEAKVDRSERQRVLKQIGRIALPLVALFLVLSSATGSAQEDPVKLFEQGRYGEAAKSWLDSGPYEQLPADTLFNIGDSAYRLGSAGEAALYYRRALERKPTHAEARQNLRFLERKFGSISIQRQDYQYMLARLPLSAWKGMVWGSLWMVAIAFLIFPATRPGAGVRMISIVAFVTAPLIAACGILAWKYYPDDARFAPPAEQVVVVADSSAVRTDAARTAPKVIDAPAGSLCRLITKSGDWAYVAFTNESRGWIPLVDIEPILPETKPAPPKLRPSQSTEGSA